MLQEPCTQVNRITNAEMLQALHLETTREVILWAEMTTAQMSFQSVTTHVWSSCSPVVNEELDAPLWSEESE